MVFWVVMFTLGAGGWLVGAAGVAVGGAQLAVRRVAVVIATTAATGLNTELRPLALSGTTRRMGANSGFPNRAGTRTQVTAAGEPAAATSHARYCIPYITY